MVPLPRPALAVLALLAALLTATVAAAWPHDASAVHVAAPSAR